MDTQRNRIARRSAGFTLIEVLLVIVIIGMLATVLIVTVGGTGEGAKIDTTKLSLDKLSNRIEMYAMHMGHVPTEAEGGLNALMTEPAGGEEKAAGDKKWRGPYAEERELIDAWQNKFNYEAVEAGTSVGGKKFKLWSNGPDGQSNTADDLKNWTETNT